MKRQKVSLADMQSKLSRMEMKNIMAGSVEDPGDATGQCGIYCNFVCRMKCPADSYNWVTGICYYGVAPYPFGKCFCTYAC